MQTALLCLCLCLLSTALLTPVSMALPGFPACCRKRGVYHPVSPSMLSAAGKHALYLHVALLGLAGEGGRCVEVLAQR